MKTKTSLTDPLIVDQIGVPGTPGRIGMTLLPGRSDDLSMFGNRWRRDLATDIERIRTLDPALILTLNEAHEFAACGVPDFVNVMVRCGIPWRHAPIPDGGVPDAKFERIWESVGAEARTALRAGGLVIIHCRAGLGRTGMIAAKLLVELGTSPEDAITAVRAGQPARIETTAQADYVRSARSIDE
jgi:hypothetical protein